MARIEHSAGRSEWPSRLPLGRLPGGVAARARRLANLRDRLVAALGGEEAPHIVGVSAAKGKLVIFADSPAWCTRLRYRAPEIEEAAARALTGKRSQISFRVEPPRLRAAERPRPELSARVRATLDAAARSMDAHGAAHRPLAAALRRLAED